MCFQPNNCVVNINDILKLCFQVKIITDFKGRLPNVFLFIPNYNKGFHMNNQKSIISNSNIDSDWSIDYVSSLSPK